MVMTCEYRFIDGMLAMHIIYILVWHAYHSHHGIGDCIGYSIRLLYCDALVDWRVRILVCDDCSCYYDLWLLPVVPFGPPLRTHQPRVDLLVHFSGNQVIQGRDA